MNLLPGVQVVVGAADAAIGTSGRRIRVYCIHLYGGTGNCSCILRNGTSSSGTAYAFIGTTSGTSNTINFAGGMLFPSGCFLDQSFGAADQASVIYSEQV